MFKSYQHFSKKCKIAMDMLFFGSALNPKQREPLKEWKHLTAFESLSSVSNISDNDIIDAMEWVGFSLNQGRLKYDCHVSIQLMEGNSLKVDIESVKEGFSYHRIFKPIPNYLSANHMHSTTEASS